MMLIGHILIFFGWTATVIHLKDWLADRLEAREIVDKLLVCFVWLIVGVVLILIG